MHAEQTVEQVIPGLWRIPVAIPLPGLHTLFVFAFELPDGLVLVDAGWSSAGSLASLEEGLTAIGAGVADVRGAVFTHAHGDHYGLAGPVRERSGAWIALHEADVPLIEARLDESVRSEDDFGDWLTLAGVPDHGEQETMRPGRGQFLWEFPAVLPDRQLVDGELLDVGGWQLEVLHTPGHTPGHIALVERRVGVVLTGDAVLPRITPNISASPHALDPLSDYLAALERVGTLGNLTGLPSHGAELPSTAIRADEIREHHEEQLRETLELVEAGAETVRDVAERMPWSRPWSALPGYERRAALGEAQAHLVALETRGVLVRVAGRPLRWRVPAVT
jgi:glyoxylase-like metal-dependent hydrolase (beta-lactamase superfamily II)